MNNFNELPPHERMMFIAKIYHNIWYDQKRFELMSELLKQWDKYPIKEAKFFNEIQSNGDNNIENII